MRASGEIVNPETELPTSDTRDWRDIVGPTLTDLEVRRLLSVNEDEFGELVSRGRLLLLPKDESGSAQIPAFQFFNGEFDPVVAEAAAQLLEGSHVQPLTAASWFNTRNSGLEDQTPLEYLRAGRNKEREEALIRAAVRTRARTAG